MNLTHPRDELMATMERIYRYRMTTTSGGNLSIRDEDGAVWITPARVDKGSLRREDIVCVRPDGTVEGNHPPSSEFPFHRAIYEARPDVRGIVHAHPVALVAFSICGRTPDTKILPQAWHYCGTVGFAPYALPGSEALGRSIAASFREGFSSVILENHGVVTAGPSLHEAFQRFETLEFAAKTILKASRLGPVRSLSAEQAARRRPLLDCPEAPARATVPSAEKELRRQLAQFVRRAYQQRLMISTEGAFSTRLGDDAFLITRHRVDRHTIGVEDLVLVQNGVPESGKVPSSSSGNHRAIYRAHLKVNAIVHAYPVNATAYSVTESPLDTRTIPESYIFLRDVGRVPHDLQFGDGTELAARTSPTHPILLLENDGVQVCGTSVLDAFDRLEVLESTAEAMINATSLGEISLMPGGVIDELERAFGLS